MKKIYEQELIQGKQRYISKVVRLTFWRTYFLNRGMEFYVKI
jgi:hypothetical protein